MKRNARDTTIKLDAAVVCEVADVLPERKTLTAFVREAVIRDIRRRKLRAAATLYREVFELDPGEAASMEEWEAAPLTTEPEKRKLGRAVQPRKS
jgi:hypothetical protein